MNNQLNYPHLTQQENQWLNYLIALPSDQMTKEYNDYYAYLMQKVRTPPQMQTIPQHQKPIAAPKASKGKGKKKTVVRKSDGTLGAWLLGGVIMFICLRFIWNEIQNAPIQKERTTTEKRVVYQRK